MVIVITTVASVVVTGNVLWLRLYLPALHWDERYPPPQLVPLPSNLITDHLSDHVPFLCYGLLSLLKELAQKLGQHRGAASQEMGYSLTHPYFGIVNEASCFQGTFVWKVRGSLCMEKACPHVLPCETFSIHNALCGLMWTVAELSICENCQCCEEG